MKINWSNLDMYEIYPIYHDLEMEKINLLLIDYKRVIDHDSKEYFETEIIGKVTALMLYAETEKYPPEMNPFPHIKVEDVLSSIREKLLELGIAVTEKTEKKIRQTLLVCP
jgi:hypothetical protein